jgi:hypothetical protein
MPQTARVVTRKNSQSGASLLSPNFRDGGPAVLSDSPSRKLRNQTNSVMMMSEEAVAVLEEIQNDQHI